MLKTLYLVIAGWVMALEPIGALVSPTFPEPQHCSNMVSASLYPVAACAGHRSLYLSTEACWVADMKVISMRDFRDGAQWSILLEQVRSHEDLWRSSWEHLTQVLYD